MSRPHCEFLPATQQCWPSPRQPTAPLQTGGGGAQGGLGRGQGAAPPVFTSSPRAPASPHPHPSLDAGPGPLSSFRNLWASREPWCRPWNAGACRLPVAGAEHRHRRSPSSGSPVPGPRPRPNLAETTAVPGPSRHQQSSSAAVPKPVVWEDTCPSPSGSGIQNRGDVREPEAFTMSPGDGDVASPWPTDGDLLNSFMDPKRDGVLAPPMPAPRGVAKGSALQFCLPQIPAPTSVVPF